MKRNFLVLALLAVGSAAVCCNSALAYGRFFPCLFPGHCLSRYYNVQVSAPYNAFTPFCGGYMYNYGVTNGGGCCAPCGGGGCGSFCNACPSYFGMAPGYPVCAAPTPYPMSYAQAPYAPMPYAPMPYAQMPTMPAPLMQATMPYGGGYYGYGVQPAGYATTPVELPPMRNAFGN